VEGGEPVIDQAFDRIARVIEVMLALAFIFAVVLNFANVVGLRMDVLIRFLPTPVRAALRIAEQVLLAALAGFVLTQSYFYARQMWRIGRTSDMAGIPMWIPHATVALGFALILVTAVWGLVRMTRRLPEREAKP
jgi:TRAP-type C4-dicarboxylate transport system permease small subunit